MAGFNLIHWDQKYTVHVDAIDQQHQKLFDIVNELIGRYEENEKKCYDIIEQLVDFLAEHFRVERRLMLEINYPAFAAHMQQHDNFMNKMEEFIKACRSGENITAEMLAFLENWIFTHTTNVDTKYGEYLLKTRPKGK